MTTARISTDRPDLSSVLGELAEDVSARLTEELAGADAGFVEILETLDERGGAGFHSGGVVLETEVSGQAMIRILVEDAKGSVGFAAELRPKNFYGDEDNPWQPGRTPLQMETDGWDVGGEVTVRFKTRVSGRPYTIQEQVLEIPDERHDAPEQAVAAFVALCERLTELALSRDPTVTGWKPEIPESVGGPPVA